MATAAEAIIPRVRSHEPIKRHAPVTDDRNKSDHRPLGLCLRAVAGATFFVAAIGCGADEADPGACEAVGEVRIADGAEQLQQGQVIVRDVVDTTLDENGEPQDVAISRVQASFGTVTATDTGPALIPFGSACAGIVSQPSNLGGTELQSAGQVTVVGLFPEPLEVPPLGEGRYQHVGMPQLAAAVAAAVEIVGTGAAFGPFTIQVPVAAPLALRAPVLDGTAPLTPSPLTLEWNAGAADYVELRIAPVSDDPLESGGQVVCQVPDTGCYALPASATSFLLSSNTATFTLSVQRTNIRIVQPEMGRSVEASVVSEVRATLVNGVTP